MKHHFADFLDRDGDYWTLVPNRERYAFRVGDVPPNSPEITIVTIGKDEENWKTVLALPNLEELTLHEPTRDQLQAIGESSYSWQVNEYQESLIRQRGVSDVNLFEI